MGGVQAEPQRKGFEEVPTSDHLAAATAKARLNFPTFETWLQSQLHTYQNMVDEEYPPDAEELIRSALAHVSTIHLGAHAFDAVKAFFQQRNKFAPVKLFVAEDNEAVIKILSKGRCPKLRHVARTRRINLDWCYEAFRWPEVKCSYVSTQYQIADIGTKAITKGDVWDRLIGLMGIKAPGRATAGKKADVTKNKLGQTTSSGSAPTSIGEKDLKKQAMALMSSLPSQAPAAELRGCGGLVATVASKRGTPGPEMNEKNVLKTFVQTRSCAACGAYGSDARDCMSCLISTAPSWHTSSPPPATSALSSRTSPSSTERPPGTVSRAKKRRARRAARTTDVGFDAID